MTWQEIPKAARAHMTILGVLCIIAVAAVWVITFANAPSVCSAAMPGDWTCLLQGRISIAALGTALVVLVAGAGILTTAMRRGHQPLVTVGSAVLILVVLALSLVLLM